ncbi:hypothetical protein Patl1_02450 [Pistacia atlantica]|uniref:Uncharacterized protein n=1 Tax=Pistacia atlantica TaxID=434234 RepID=A0ACC1C8T5_9ROSI|nr:hypothetical protein Patl1_02450 [Pistacia atlantica]
MALAQEDLTWQELLGNNNWEKLLDPLDLSLGSSSSAAATSFRPPMTPSTMTRAPSTAVAAVMARQIFSNKVMLESALDYQVFSFLYDTARVSLPEAFLLHSMSRESWDRESNWIGYIAVTSDERSKSIGRHGNLRGVAWDHQKL